METNRQKLLLVWLGWILHCWKGGPNIFNWRALSLYWWSSMLSHYTHDGKLHTHLKFKYYSAHKPPPPPNKQKCNWKLVKITRFKIENNLLCKDKSNIMTAWLTSQQDFVVQLLHSLHCESSSVPINLCLHQASHLHPYNWNTWGEERRGAINTRWIYIQKFFLPFMPSENQKWWKTEKIPPVSTEANSFFISAENVVTQRIHSQTSQELGLSIWLETLQTVLGL